MKCNVCSIDRIWFLPINSYPQNIADFAYFIIILSLCKYKYICKFWTRKRSYWKLYFHAQYNVFTILNPFSYFWLNLKDRKHIIDSNAEETLTLITKDHKVICVQDSSTAVSLIWTLLNCTAAFKIHFAAIFEHFNVAIFSICFHGHIVRSTERKFLLHILPQVQPKLALLSPCWHL